MKMVRFLAFSLFFIAAGCADGPERRYEKMATAWADCVRPMVELNARAEKLMSNADSVRMNQAEIRKLFHQMEAAERSAVSCSSIIRDKYGVLKTAEWPAAEPFFWKKCPSMQAHAEKLHEMLGE